MRDISVAPLDASDQQQIIKMMDDPDPSAQFRKKRIIKNQAGSLIDPLKVPLLSDIDKRSDKAAAALKSFHLGKHYPKIVDDKNGLRFLYLVVVFIALSVGLI